MQYSDAQSGKDFVTYLTLSPVQMTFHGTGSTLQASHDQVSLLRCIQYCVKVVYNNSKVRMFLKNMPIFFVCFVFVVINELNVKYTKQKTHNIHALLKHKLAVYLWSQLLYDFFKGPV